MPATPRASAITLARWCWPSTTTQGLRHVGQVGTGFDQKQMRAIYEQLQPLVTKTSPLRKKPRLKDVTWVQPELVCQIRFLETTPDGMLRAPVFLSLRTDKNPADVVLEQAEEPDQVVAEAEPPPSSGALDFSGKELLTEVDGHHLKFTNLNKIFFPQDGWKKRDLLRFYDRVAPLSAAAPERSAAVHEALSERDCG